MKSPILLLAVSVLLLASCATAYKTGQTPDDVYYSAAKPQNETDKTDKEDNRRYSYDDDYYDDRYLRMKVQNRYRWTGLEEWYGYDRYSIGYNYYYGSFNNPYNRWNYYYNPYCCCTHNYVYVNPKLPSAPPVVKRQFNLSGYNNTSYNNSNNNAGVIKQTVKTTRPVYNNTNSNNNANSNNGLSNKLKTIFSNDNSGSGSSRTYNPSSSSGSARTNNNSSSSSSSSSGSSSGSSGGNSGGGVSRPTRN